MKLIVSVLVALFISFSGLLGADHARADWVCEHEEQVEPTEEDFESWRAYYSFLNRRAQWARGVEQGNRIAYAQWLYDNGYWERVTDVELEWACHQYNRTIGSGS